MEFRVLLGKQRFGALPRGVEFNNGEPCTPGSEKGNERSQGQMWNVCIVINMLNSSKHWLSFYWSSLFRSCLYTSALLKVLIVTISDMNIPPFSFQFVFLFDKQKIFNQHASFIGFSFFLYLFPTRESGVFLKTEKKSASSLPRNFEQTEVFEKINDYCYFPTTPIKLYPCQKIAIRCEVDLSSQLAGFNAVYPEHPWKQWPRSCREASFSTTQVCNWTTHIQSRWPHCCFVYCFLKYIEK